MHTNHHHILSDFFQFITYTAILVFENKALKLH